MSATIVNETTYTVWCGECPFSTEPTIYRERAEAAADRHDAEKHPEQIERAKLMRDPVWDSKPA